MKGKLRYKPFTSFAINTVRLFTNRHKVEGNVYDGPCVYLARHLDAGGVTRVFCDVKDVMTPWVLDIFFDYKRAKRHFSEYTFSKKAGKSKLFCAVASPICARFITGIVKSMQSIPVYRGKDGARSITTLKQSVNALCEGKRLLIFIDKDYADCSEKTSGEIYQGFAAIGRLYYRRTRKHVPFIPIYTGKDKTVIHKPVYFTDLNENEEYVSRKTQQSRQKSDTSPEKESACTAANRCTESETSAEVCDMPDTESVQSEKRRKTGMRSHSAEQAFAKITKGIFNA